MRLITHQQLKAELDAGQPIKLVMTAGPWQVRAKHIPGTLKLLTPKDALGALRPEDPIVVYTIDDRLHSRAAAWEALTAHGYATCTAMPAASRIGKPPATRSRARAWQPQPVAAGRTGTASTAGSSGGLSAL
jgi:hypothetical protein